MHANVGDGTSLLTIDRYSPPTAQAPTPIASAQASKCAPTPLSADGGAVRKWTHTLRSSSLVQLTLSHSHTITSYRPSMGRWKACVPERVFALYIQHADQRGAGGRAALKTPQANRDSVRTMLDTDEPICSFHVFVQEPSYHYRTSKPPYASTNTGLTNRSHTYHTSRTQPYRPSSLLLLSTSYLFAASCAFFLRSSSIMTVQLLLS